ncbi:MAG TPA: protein kinase [Labilithrix sp.]|nr:protein kinase [Labilithrix sp.]
MVGIPQPGDEILGGKYAVERVIGVGGMGVVVAAVHKKLGQRVAIKFLSRTMQTTELVDRFVREGQACARIKSEHIASVLDVGVLESGTPYLMMEYLEGTDLDDYIMDQGSIPFEDAVDFVLQACDALAVAHSSGIVHRDLKPSNLFVTYRSDGSPLIKVLDFGISKIGESASLPNPKSTLTRPGTMLGSPRYVSPEQLRNASGVDHRADIWALGIVLHELVAGDPPYVSDTFADLCAMITTEPPVPLRQVRPDAPELLEEIILKCIEKKPENRFQNVAELAMALAPLASDESRVIALRVGKILGFISAKTPPGQYTSSRALGATPRPHVRGNTPPHIRKSRPSDPTMLRDSASGTSGVSAGTVPTDPNVSALSVSSENVAKGRSARLGGVLALLGLMAMIAALALTAVRRSPPPSVGATTTAAAPATATATPASAAPVPTVATVATVAPAEAPSVMASAPVTPALTSTPKSTAPSKARPKAPHASGTSPQVAPISPSSPGSVAPPAPPSESDMLNRRH